MIKNITYGIILMWVFPERKGDIVGKDLKGNELGKGIVQKRNGQYEARYVNRFGERKSISGRDLRDVKRRYLEAVYENEKEINIKEKVKMEDWYVKWMTIYKEDLIRQNTKRIYDGIYHKYIAPTFGKLYLTDIAQYQIRELLRNIAKQGYGYETQNKVRILLLDIFNKALSNDFIRKNPAKGISLKRNEEKEPKVLTTEEQTTFFDCCRGTFYDNFFVVAVNTGMRIGEIAALRWEDIDWQKNVIHVTRTLVYQNYEGDEKKEFHFEDPKTKTSKRDIPINRQCSLALKRQLLQKRVVEVKAPKSKKPREEFLDLLFTTTFNTPLNSQLICQAIKRVVDEINLTRDYLDEMEPFSAHCLRHTFATRAFEAGVLQKTVQKYLGHATLQMTMDLYTAVMPKHLTDEMDKVEAMMDKVAEAGDEITEEKYNRMENNSKVILFPGDSMVV